MIKELFVYSDGRLVCGDKTYRCVMGKNGVTDNKKEGDGCTPLGSFPLREIFYRSDMVEAPATSLPIRATALEDGWCDDPADPMYNRLVKLPYAASHEELWRNDRIYDIVCMIGYNDAPALPGKGSAIFMHIAREDYAPTEGCVAVSLPDMIEILKEVGPESLLTIARA